MSERSWATSPAVRKTMQSNKSRDTSPELAVRRILYNHGLRYRVDARPEKKLNRRADIVFTRRQVAVFIDGCFWHRCPAHFIAPKANADFWEAKLSGNVSRDQDTNERLVQSGWTVLRFWSHQDPTEIAAVIEANIVGGQDKPRSLGTAQ